MSQQVKMRPAFVGPVGPTANPPAPKIEEEKKEEVPASDQGMSATERLIRAAKALRR